MATPGPADIVSPGSLGKLAPLEHVRALYKEAEHSLIAARLEASSHGAGARPKDAPPPQIALKTKQDLLQALAQATGHEERDALGMEKGADGILTSTYGRNSQPGDSASSSASASASAAAGGGGGGGKAGAMDAAESDAASSKAVLQLEAAILSHSKRYNALKAMVNERRARLSKLQLERQDLAKQVLTIAQLDAATRIVTKGRTHGLDMLNSKVTLQEAAEAMHVGLDRASKKAYAGTIARPAGQAGGGGATGRAATALGGTRRPGGSVVAGSTARPHSRATVGGGSVAGGGGGGLNAGQFGSSVLHQGSVADGDDGMMMMMSGGEDSSEEEEDADGGGFWAEALGDGSMASTGKGKHGATAARGTSRGKDGGAGTGVGAGSALTAVRSLMTSSRAGGATGAGGGGTMSHGGLTVGGNPSLAGGPSMLTAAEMARVDATRHLRKSIKAVRRLVARRQFILAQYKHMETRLRTNATTMDAHLAGLESAIQASKKEAAEVAAYTSMLEGNRASVAREVERFHAGAVAMRERWAADLEGKKKELVKLLEAEAWSAQRAEVRAEMRAELSGDLSAEQEQLLLSTLAAKQAAFTKLQAERRQREERAAALQEAYTKIKGITGVHTLSSMADRFLSQPATRAALEKERLDAEARLHFAKDAYEKAHRDYTNLRASGATGVAAAVALAAAGADVADADSDNVKQEEEVLTKTILKARHRLRTSHAACERLTDILMAVKQGITGLARTIQPFAVLLGPDLPPLKIEPPATRSSSPVAVAVAVGGAGAGDGSGGMGEGSVLHDLTADGGNGEGGGAMTLHISAPGGSSGSSGSVKGSADAAGSGGGGGGDSPGTGRTEGDAMDSRKLGSSALQLLRATEVHVNVLVRILALASREYLLYSLQSREAKGEGAGQAGKAADGEHMGGLLLHQPSAQALAHAATAGQAGGLKAGEPPVPINHRHMNSLFASIPQPGDVPASRKPYAALPDADLLTFVQALLRIPSVDRRGEQAAEIRMIARLESQAGGSSAEGAGGPDLTLALHDPMALVPPYTVSDIGGSIPPGVACQLLKLCSAVSTRMIAVAVPDAGAGTRSGLGPPKPVGPDGEEEEEDGPAEPDTSNLAVHDVTAAGSHPATRQRRNSVSAEDHDGEGSVYEEGSAQDSGGLVSPVARGTGASSSGAGGKKEEGGGKKEDKDKDKRHWTPFSNMDPVLHGTNVRVRTRTGFDPVTGAPIARPAAVGGGHGHGGKGGHVVEEDEGVAAPGFMGVGIHLLAPSAGPSVFQYERARRRASLGLPVDGPMEASLLGGNAVSADLYDANDPLNAGLRTGLAQNQMWMDAASAARYAHNERLEKAARAGSAGNRSGKGSDGGDGSDGDGDHSPQGDGAGGATPGAGRRPSQGGRATGPSDGGPVNLMANREKDAGEAVLDRSIIKKLSSAMATLDAVNKEAAALASTPAGPKAIKRAAQRRASIARLLAGGNNGGPGSMLGQAGSAIPAIPAGGTRGLVLPTPPALAAAPDAHADSDGPSKPPSRLMLQSTSAVSKGLAVYLTKPKLL